MPNPDQQEPTGGQSAVAGPEDPPAVGAERQVASSDSDDKILQDPPGSQPQGLPQVLRVVKKEQNPPPHIDTVRAWIAAGLIMLLAGAVIATLIVWSYDEGSTIDDMTPIVTALIAMIGPILGFYFSTKSSGGPSD